MNEYLNRLNAERQNAWHRAKEIMDTAAGESRDLSAEERVELDRIDARLDETKVEAEKIRKMAEAVRTSDAFRLEAAPTVEAARESRRDPTDREMLLEMFRGERRSFESRALQSAGGSAIPTTFADFVTVYERTLNPTLQVASVLNTPTGNPIVLPRLTADPAHGGTVTAEAAGINELDPTISSVQLDSYKYAVVTLWSAELGQDEVIGLEDLIARSVGRELGLDIGAHLTTGNGTGQPNGFITAATVIGTAAGLGGGSTATFIGTDDLITLYYGLAAPYRAVGVWQMSNAMIQKARKFRDLNGQYLWTPSVTIGQPDQFYGRPVYENPGMAAPASATKSVAFGDFSRYYVRRLPLRVSVSEDYKFSNDQLAIKVVERVDGDLIDTAAIGVMISANS